jgi:membrane-bound lytic murein transglycosylase D
LAKTAYVDERFDPEKSTRAYARYMRYIYNQTGDWYLSMAGYNWGTGNVQRAVEKTGYADFWELYKRHNLPAETQNYVPEILAAIIIANHPTQYGFDDLTLDPPVLTDTVTINYSVDLHLVSDIVSAPMDEMTALNPSLLRSVTPPDTSFDLHLPAGMAALFEKQIALIPEGKRNSWRYHRVKAEDTLASVAREYRVTVAELASANQLEAGNGIEGVEALVVPAAPSAAPSTHALLYTVRKGETLVTIADRFGVSLDQLRRWNKITGFKVEPGRRLHVAEVANAPRAGRTHRRGVIAQNHEESGAKAHESSPRKKSGTGSPSPASKKNGEAAATKMRSSAAKKPRVESLKSAAGAEKSDADGARKRAATRAASKEKSPHRKEK